MNSKEETFKTFFQISPKNSASAMCVYCILSHRFITVKIVPANIFYQASKDYTHIVQCTNVHKMW
jgi:hypothetical protein